MDRARSRRTRNPHPALSGPVDAVNRYDATLAAERRLPASPILEPSRHRLGFAAARSSVASLLPRGLRTEAPTVLPLWRASVGTTSASAAAAPEGARARGR